MTCDLRPETFDFLPPSLPVSLPSPLLLTCTGLVQGVGFRPTVWRLARDLSLPQRAAAAVAAK